MCSCVSECHTHLTKEKKVNDVTDYNEVNVQDLKPTTNSLINVLIIIDGCIKQISDFSAKKGISVKSKTPVLRSP